MSKNVIYTCITGGYDNLIEPTYVTEGFDYVCFTDDETLTSNTWDIRPMPKETDGLSLVKKQRYVKVNPHKVLSEYDLSIWIDGNIAVTDNLFDFMKEYNIDGSVSVYVPKHPSRVGVFEEVNAILGFQKDTFENMKPQIERYQKEGLPQNTGLLQSRILVRKHNDPSCIKLMEAWFNEIRNGSHRDQISFNYAAWKNPQIQFVYLNEWVYKSKYFRCVFTHNK
jgi:hypothetical protein